MGCYWYLLLKSHLRPEPRVAIKVSVSPRLNEQNYRGRPWGKTQRALVLFLVIESPFARSTNVRTNAQRAYAVDLNSVCVGR